jgi:predicted molibdopterin-dependent oxidoreductase YjgC
MITGKLGKTANGLISLKEKNNSQGLFDMGISTKNGIGNIDLTDDKYAKKLAKKWNVDKLPEQGDKCMKDQLNDGLIKKFYIFGEDPVGCSTDKAKVQKWFADAEFVLVQDYFMTETAKLANLVLPASFPIETSGSFTNTQKNIQIFEKQFKGKVEFENYQQLIQILNQLNETKLDSVEKVREEIFEILSGVEKKENYELIYTEKDNLNKLFKHGCDYIVKYYDEHFKQSFEVAKENIKVNA